MQLLPAPHPLTSTTETPRTETTPHAQTPAHARHIQRPPDPVCTAARLKPAPDLAEPATLRLVVLTVMTSTPAHRVPARLGGAEAGWDDRRVTPDHSGSHATPTRYGKALHFAFGSGSNFVLASNANEVPV